MLQGTTRPDFLRVVGHGRPHRAHVGGSVQGDGPIVPTWSMWPYRG